MSEPIVPPPPPAPPPSPPPALAPALSKSWFRRHGIISALIAVLMIGVAGAAVAAATAGRPKGNASRHPAATAAPSSSQTTFTDSPTQDPTPESSYTPKPADFPLAIKVRSKECFGSAGCVVTYRISIGYSGGDVFTGKYDVTYEVFGDESGPQVETFTIDGNGHATFDASDVLQTRSSKTKIHAKAIRVDPSADAAGSDS